MKNLFLLSSFLAISIIFFSCEKTDKRETYFIETCSSTDSIVTFYRKNRLTVSPKYFDFVTRRLVKERKIEDIERILTLRSEFLDELNDLEKSYYYLAAAAFYTSRNPDLALNNLKAIPESELKKRDSVAVEYYQILGHFHYNKNQIDSAFEYFKQGYSVAMELGDTLSMGRISVNLGGLQSIMGYDFAAMEYLLRALSFDPKNLILANNLASVLIKQKQLDRAKEVLDEHKEVLNISLPNQEQIMFRLTYIHLYQELGLWDKSRSLLLTIPLAKVPVNQVYNFHSFWVLYYENTNSEQVKPYLDEILKDDGPDGYSELFYYLSNWAYRMKMDRIHEHFASHVSVLDTVNLDPISQSVFFQLLGKNADKVGNVALAAMYKSKSAIFLRDYFQEKLETKELDLLNRLDLYRLERKYAETKFETESLKSASKRKSLILAFGTLLLGIIGYAWYQQRNLRIKNESLTKDLFEQKEKELEILEREKETSKKLVELSSRILDTSKKLKSKLATLPEKNLPGIKESLEDLDYILFLNQSVDTTVISTGYDFDRLPFLAEMIVSQRNVLSLTLDDYRPKEIGVTLNLSYSYVRNVQTRLRKTLKDNGFETFEELKKFLDS